MAAAARSHAHVSVSLIAFDSLYKRISEVSEIPEIAPMATREREPDEVVLVVCDDSLKRLLMVTHGLDLQMSEGQKKVHRLSKSILDMVSPREIGGGSQSELFDKLFNENAERDALREQVRSLEAELRTIAPMLQLANATYQAELVLHFSELAKQGKVVLCSDWSIVAATEDDRKPAGLDRVSDMLKGMFGDDDDEGGMSLGDLLGGALGSHREPGMGRRHRHAREHERA